MELPASSLQLDWRRDTTDRVIIDVPVDDGDTDDRTVLAKACRASDEVMMLHLHAHRRHPWRR